MEVGYYEIKSRISERKWTFGGPALSNCTEQDSLSGPLEPDYAFLVILRSSSPRASLTL